MSRHPFVIPAIEENRCASGCSASVDVAPAIADHEARAKIDAEFFGCCEERAGLWLAALAVVRIIVKARIDARDRETAREFVVHRLNAFAALCPASDVRLIGDDKKKRDGA